MKPGGEVMDCVSVSENDFKQESVYFKQGRKSPDAETENYTTVYIYASEKNEE